MAELVVLAIYSFFALLNERTCSNGNISRKDRNFNLLVLSVCALCAVAYAYMMSNVYLHPDLTGIGVGTSTGDLLE